MHKKYFFIPILFCSLFSFQIVLADQCSPYVNGAYLISAPTTYCASGAMSNFVTHNSVDIGSIYWTWNCGGASCTAYRQRKATVSQPVLCSTLPGWCIGYRNATSDIGFWGSNHTSTSSATSWSCTYSGVTINCSASLGACGTSITSAKTAMPNSVNACQPGYNFTGLDHVDGFTYQEMVYLGNNSYGPNFNYTASSVIFWSCGGSKCYVYGIPSNGSCGPAAKSYAYNATSYSGSQCSSGTASSSAFPAQGSSTSWDCSGTFTGYSVHCSASRAAAPVAGVCNPTHYNCNTGTSINNLQGGASWAWQCRGLNGGSTANCSQSFPSCTYNYGSWGACINGTKTRTATATNAPCIGTPVTSQSCASNGVCGSSNNSCTAGTLLDTTDTAQNYTWTCLGLNGGANASCSIPKSYCSYAGPDNTSTTGTTHDVYVYGAVNTTSVWFPTWTNSNGQDDLKWYVGTDQGGGTWKATINSANHNNELGAYIVHTYTGNGGGSIFCDTASFTRVTPVNGVCGSANLRTYPTTATNYGSYTQCAPGTSTNTAFPADGTAVGWYCNGLYGGTRSPLCAASRVGTSACGSSNGANLNTAPTTNLCVSTSTASTVSGSGPWTWTCTGKNNGTVVSCSANKITNGVCGSANLKTYPTTATNYGSYTQCAPGTSTNTAFPADGTAVGWYCNGLYGGTRSPLCAASRVGTSACGSSNGANLNTAPTTNLCVSTSTASTVSGSGPWTWTCTGKNNGTVVSCSANKITNGVCGNASGRTFTYDTSSYSPYIQCAPGTSTNTAFPAQGGSISWICNGTSGGTPSASCGAQRNAPLTNKAITSFGFNSPAVVGIINEVDHTINVTVPLGTNVTALVATFTTTGKTVNIGTIVQVSGTTVNDFSNPVSYLVIAEDGSSQIYTVTVRASINPTWRE